MNRRILLVFPLLLVACGRVDDAVSTADGGNVLPQDASLGVPDVGATDPGAPFPSGCGVGGYFIDLRDIDGATLVREGGCDDAGAPSLEFALCGEDCPCMKASACTGSASLVVASRVCAGIGKGTWDGYVESIDADEGVYSGAGGTMTITAFPADGGGAVLGTYAADLLEDPDGGALRHVTGSFCVRYGG